MPGTLAPTPALNTALPEPIAVRSSDEVLAVELSDGRTVSVPLVWYPRLSYATADERAVVEVTPFGVRWPLVNEDVSVEMILRGMPSDEEPQSLRAWTELMGRRRAQLARGDEPEPHYPTLPLPDGWDEDEAPAEEGH